jgi:hypothetical protein
LVELGDGNVGAQCLRQCCRALGAGFGSIPSTAPFLQSMLELALHGNGTSILSALADLKVGEVSKVNPGLVVELVNVGNDEDAETH